MIDDTPLVLIGCAKPAVTEGLRELLPVQRFRVEVAANGAEALDRLEQSRPPCIALLDMELPSPTGVEILWRLGRLQRPKRTWLVLVSEDTGPERTRAALECGCDDFMPLPPDPLDLKVRLRVADRVMALMARTDSQTAAMRYQSTHDRLTALWNREALLSLLFQETDRVQRMRTELCLMVLDVDGFSRINREYGYEAGDRILQEMAARLQRQLRSYDLMGRCGEDEFLLGLPGCTAEQAVALAERMRATILVRPFAVFQETTVLTASFGIAASRGRSPLVVLKEAERALAEAKRAGKNCVRCLGMPGRMLDWPLEACGTDGRTH